MTTNLPKNFRLPLLLPELPPGKHIVNSPSQIDTYAGESPCKRKWAFKYIAKLDSPPHPSAFLGTLIHAFLEPWLSRGVVIGSQPPLDRKNRVIKATKAQYEKAISVAQRMIRYLPPPGIASVERSFYLYTQWGHFYTGFIDFSFDGRQYQDPLSALYMPHFNVPVIGDHKSTGNLDYAKTEEDLHKDSQGIIYALAGFLGFNVEELLLFWNYGTTKSRVADTKPVLTRVRLPSVLEKFENVIEPIAAEMLWHRQNATDPNSFPPTLSTCTAFGGCPFRKHCKVTDQERLMFDMSNQQPAPDTMAARMAAFPGSNGAPQFAPPPTFAPPPLAAPSSATPPGHGQSGGYAAQQNAPQFAPPPVPDQQTGYAPNGYAQPPYPTVAQTFAPAQPQFALPPNFQPQTQPNALPFAPPPGGTGAPQGQQLTFQPPSSAAQPPAGVPGALPPPYSPDQGPNPPENGFQVAPGQLPPQQLQPTLEQIAESKAEAKEAKRGKGRPAGSPNKELSREQSIWLTGAAAAMSSLNFKGEISFLHQGGDLMVQAFKARFDKE